MSAVILAQLAAPGAAAGSRHSHLQRAPGRRRRARHAPIANATAAAVPPLLESVQQAAASHAALYTLETLLAATAAYAAAVWPDRPRGWCFRELLTVRPSPVAGNGVFALVDIQAGTVLGAYPGRPRTPQQMAAKVASAPSAAGYCFRTRSGRLLDPTDAAGQLSPAPAPGLPWLPIDFMLAYVNEPPLGAGGCNVTVEDDTEDPCGLLCIAARDIKAGQELFMDYGVHYDRSMYTRQRDAQPAANGGTGDGTVQ